MANEIPTTTSARVSSAKNMRKRRIIEMILSLVRPVGIPHKWASRCLALRVLRLRYREPEGKPQAPVRLVYSLEKVQKTLWGQPVEILTRLDAHAVEEIYRF